jgi:integrase
VEIGVYPQKTSYFQKEGFMKIHNDFTLYWRVFPSGKRVVYYYAYDANGKRQMGRSTGETNMTAARVKCNKLLKEGGLIPDNGYMPTFAEYARGWWEWETCAYLKKRRKRYSLTQTYANNNKKNLNNQLLKYFGGMPLNKITRDDVENWFDKLIEEDYQNTTINGYYGTLKTMLIEAVARKLIEKDPTEKMGRLVNDRREIKIITPEEFRKLFTGDWKRVWDNDRISYTANKLAALTGMRACEVLGLKGGFVFSPDGGGTPVCRKTMYQDYHRALRNIGMSDDEISERHLHLHAWRHFFNTELLKGGLSIPQAQAITGHKSDRMTEWYCHFDPNEFAQARKVQENLLQPEGTKPAKAATGAKQAAKKTAGAGQPEGGKNGGKAVRVLPFPAQEGKKQKRA